MYRLALGHIDEKKCCIVTKMDWSQSTYYAIVLRKMIIQMKKCAVFFFLFLINIRTQKLCCGIGMKPSFIFIEIITVKLGTICFTVCKFIYAKMQSNFQLSRYSFLIQVTVIS